MSIEALYEFVLKSDSRKDRILSRFVTRFRLLWKAVLSIIFQRRGMVKPAVCDVLLIHPSRASFVQGRKKPLIAALKARGLIVEEFVESGDRGLIGQRNFLSPCRTVPFLFRWYAAHAEYLLRRYDTKVILTERNGWIIPSFIKMLRHDGVKVVHLAHSVATSQSSRYHYFDYDYYFLFGQSSYKYLKALPNTFGQCVVHYCGPYFFSDKEDFSEERNEVVGQDITCLFLAPGPAYEAQFDYLESCSWVMDWLAEHPSARLWIKLHPRGKGAWWKDHLATSSERISILPEGLSLDDCAAQYDVVFSNYTNAIIDVARYAKPFVLLGAGEDYFSAEEFGVFRVRSADQLKSSVDSILLDPSFYAAKALRFFSFHVENRKYPLTSIVDSVVCIVNRKALSGVALKSADSIGVSS